MAHPSPQLAQQTPPRPADQGILIGAVAILLVMTTLGPVMTYSALPLAGEGNAPRQIIYLLILASTLYAIKPFADPSRLNSVPVPMLAALAWCWLSVSWAIDPGIALRRVSLTTVIIFTVFTAVKQLGYGRTVAMMRTALIATLIANYAAVLLFPEFGIHQDNTNFDIALRDDWRGIMQHKNFAGATSALLIPLMVFDAGQHKWQLRAPVIVAALIFLYFSQSKTSMGLCGFGMMTGYAFTYYSPRYRPLAIVGLFLVGVAVVTLLQIYKNPIHALMRDPEAFTGRTLIWRALLQYVDGHLLLGSGFGSFWNIGPSSPIYSFAQKWITELTTGHNGFLDLIVQIGVPGLALVLFATTAWPLIRILASDSLGGQRVALVISLLFFCVTHNATESSLFDRDTIIQVFLMFTIALLAPLEAEAARARDRKARGWSLRSMRDALQ